MKNFCNIFNTFGLKFQHLSLLIIRLVLAYGFYETAVPKWQNIEPTAQWFASMGFPLPFLSVYLVAIFEALAVPLFALGLFTRIISVPLIVIVLVAIFAVHFGNGYSLANNGFEVPLYYLVMLFAIFSFGAGKISLDAVMNRYER
ncbi:DoxX family protein [Campylobacter fetus]|uniref:DoxX family protein n=3 Tax=Campylobacter fetus TaxID=196 RepID=A0AAE6J0C6_CAMFE|nr:DoxX family protein [Campylobacter fetus]OCS22065.1 DoxX family protein [Campylobacter fetus subsp. venerealis cfvi97/532]OCS26408.1 DoxX family protein [Campylobacter fetus subsp. venerealis cfvB10]OCS29805.1 DoxX family protein [Campylobacter fetus subsp. venerealis LMG 6570 = CCUG 33900]OCS42791.1 DoxX family protein [Campylobacter fetus subsp. venerealis cfvi02/298]ABK82348.1 integral membrane protein [Campylobacter fetus subsp. fetus 82-40]